MTAISEKKFLFPRSVASMPHVATWAIHASCKFGPMATAAPLGGYRGGPAGRISEDHGDGADGTDTRARAKKYARRWRPLQATCRLTKSVDRTQTMCCRIKNEINLGVDFGIIAIFKLQFFGNIYVRAPNK
jgi:hypothetical protein